MMDFIHNNWILTQAGCDINSAQAFEGLFTLGSGYLHTRGSLEDLSLYELDEISKGLVGWFDLMGGSMEEGIKGNGFLNGQEVFTQLEGLNSSELDYVYEILKTRYFRSTTSLPMSMG